MKTDCQWEHPYAPVPEYRRRVAYFSMEFGIDTALKTYAGGLGYLAGSHMRSAFDLKQNLIGIGILWKNGYYDQVWNRSGQMGVLYRSRHYTFLEETDLVIPVNIHGHEVKVHVYHLPPEVFGTVPMYLLSTDHMDSNDFISRTITERLYDNNAATRVAQSMVLGIGGAKVVEALGGADIYHMNEAHALPLAFYLHERFGDVKEVRKRLAFTTHTPVAAGNEARDIDLLQKMRFFGKVPLPEVRRITHMQGHLFGYTPAALALSGAANGVSRLHGKVARDMWSSLPRCPEIIGITNAQHRGFWQERMIRAALDKDDDERIRKCKLRMKAELFELVADQTGKLLDSALLTVVWARRFAGYKRADLILRDLTLFYELLEGDRPIQVLWAGKPFPEDDVAVQVFNRIIDRVQLCRRAAVITGYEMRISAMLKRGADVWLNTPRRPLEASGTSGITAAMNGAVNFSTNDGWVPEFARHGENSFVIPEAAPESSEERQDDHDHRHLVRILTSQIVPTYYDRPDRWSRIVKNSMRDVVPYFDSARMAAQYYERLYSATSG